MEDNDSEVAVVNVDDVRDLHDRIEDDELADELVDITGVEPETTLNEVVETFVEKHQSVVDAQHVPDNLSFGDDFALHLDFDHRAPGVSHIGGSPRTEGGSYLSENGCALEIRYFEEYGYIDSDADNRADIVLGVTLVEA